MSLKSCFGNRSYLKRVETPNYPSPSPSPSPSPNPKNALGLY